jgi:hypothetical protein
VERELQVLELAVLELPTRERLVPVEQGLQAPERLARETQVLEVAVPELPTRERLVPVEQDLQAPERLARELRLLAIRELTARAGRVVPALPEPGAQELPALEISQILWSRPPT